MNYEKANQWLKQSYPKLHDYRVRAISYFVYHTVCLREQEVKCEDKVRVSPAPDGFVYVIASCIKGGYFDIVLLMPEDV